LIWATRVAGTALPERVAGSDLIWSVSEAASHRDISVFLLGGNPVVAERAASALLKRYSGLEIVGTLCPPFGFEDDVKELNRIQREVKEAAPQIVFVGLGFPKQDLLIARLREILPCVTFMGVGISFGFVAGELRRAPSWTQGLGLEWLYRLQQEPRRLGRRYLVRGMPFALWLLASAAWHRVSAGGGSLWGQD
jgi:N-acetylglucosaminyldiphosphoundecaprenol N-acetyl-beta-D-mannosaminyltransferase